MGDGECCLECTRLLNEGLNLCVRARKLDQAMLETEMEKHGWTGTRCLTPHVWLQDQYDRDLAEWEQATRQHIMGAHQ